MRLIDSHAHIASDEIFPEVESILERAKRAGVSDIINICTDDITLRRGLELSSKYPWVHNVASTTPHDVLTEGEKLFSLMAKHAKQGDLVAIGETGLDYFHHHSPPEMQKEFLRRYLQLALECNLPVVIHCRDAFSDFFKILDEEYIVSGKHAPGVLHCFTGTAAEAEEVIKRGWYISFSGIVTFKKSEPLREIVRKVPLEQILIETDAPYLAPQSHRGKLNEPGFISETAAVIASSRGVSVDEVAAVTSTTAEKLFRLRKTNV